MSEFGPFQRVIPGPTDAKRLESLNQFFNELHQYILGDIPPSRYRSMAISQLEISAMLAAKAITHGDD